MENLSDDVLFCIYIYLNNREFGRLRQTCRRLRDVRIPKCITSARKCGIYGFPPEKFSLNFCGHKECIRYIIRRAPISSMQSRQLFQMAADRGNVSILRHLCARGMHLDLCGMALIGAHQIETLKFLIENGLSKKDVAHNCYYIFMLASFNCDIVKLLFSLDIDVRDVFEMMTMRILSYLIGRKKYDTLIFLLDKIGESKRSPKINVQLREAYFRMTLAKELDPQKQIIMDRIKTFL